MPREPNLETRRRGSFFPMREFSTFTTVLAVRSSCSISSVLNNLKTLETLASQLPKWSASGPFVQGLRVGRVWVLDLSGSPRGLRVSGLLRQKATGYRFACGTAVKSKASPRSRRQAKRKCPLEQNPCLSKVGRAGEETRGRQPQATSFL